MTQPPWVYLAILSIITPAFTLWSSNLTSFFFFFNLFIYLFIYFWLCWVFVAARGLSLVAASGDYSVAVHGLLIAVASLVAEHRL